MRKLAVTLALSLAMAPTAGFAEDAAPPAAAPATNLEKATDTLKKASDFGKKPAAAPAEKPTEGAAPAATETTKTVPEKPADVPSTPPVGSPGEGSALDKATSTIQEKAAEKATGGVTDKALPGTPEVPAKK